MGIYETIKVCGRTHILTGSNRNGYYPEFIHCIDDNGNKMYNDFGVPTMKKIDGEPIPSANYMNTGMALTGVLRHGESLSEFITRKNAMASS